MEETCKIENFVCFLCNYAFKSDDNYWRIFNTHLLIENQLQRSIPSILTSALGREVTENTVHSTLLCQDCKKLTFEYAILEHRFNDFRYQILTTYNNTAKLYNFSPIEFNIQSVIENVENVVDIEQITTFEEEGVAFDGDFLSPIKSVSDGINELTEDEVTETFIYKDLQTPQFPFKSSKKKVYDVKDRRYQCDVCEKRFRKSADLKQHKERHKDMSEREKQFQCHICNKWFFAKKNLQQHIKRHDEAPKEEDVETRKIYKCDKCDRRYTSIYKLKYHIEGHNGRERRFACELCDKRFYSNQNLKEHKKSHVDVKAFSCEFCGELFKTDRNLKVHLLIHTNPKSFKCQVCGKGFTRESYVKVHENNHKKEVPCKCRICKAEFNSRVELLAHKKSKHTRNYSIKCEECGKPFTGPRYLKLHKCPGKSAKQKKIAARKKIEQAINESQVTINNGTAELKSS